MNTIMIVDDDPCIRELVSAVLKNEGFITYEASDGRDALRKRQTQVLTYMSLTL